MKRPLFNLSILIASGIFSASFFSLYVSLGLVMAGLLIFILFPLLKKESSSNYILYLLFFLMGIGLYDCKVFFPSPDRIDQLESQEKEIHLRGRVTDVVQISGRKEGLLDVSQVNVEGKYWTHANGKILVRQAFDPLMDIKAWDEIEIKGKIVSLPFSRIKDRSTFGAWLRSEGIVMVVEISKSTEIQKLGSGHLNFFEKSLRALKLWCSSKLSAGFSDNDPAHDLLSAMVLGTREDLDPHLKDAFLYTNTIHILSISGLHLSVILVALLFVLGLFPISRPWGYAFSLFAIWFYAIMTGLGAPILRSAIMATFYLLGKMARVKVDLANSLGASALVMIIPNPLILFNAGFQLSFLCLIALIFLTPIIENDLRFLERVPPELISSLLDKKERYFARAIQTLIKVVSGSLAVWVGVLPVIAYHFGIFSGITVLANLLAVPLVGFIMNVGFASCILGFFHWISLSFNQVNIIALNLLVFLMDHLSKLPGAYTYVQKPSWTWFLAYDGILFLGLFRAKGRIKAVYFFAAAVLLVPLLLPQKKSGELDIHFISNEWMQGQMIEWPNQERSLWVRTLDHNHISADHTLMTKSQNPTNSLTQEHEEGSRMFNQISRLPFFLKVKKIEHIFLSGADSLYVKEFLKIFRSALMNPALESVLNSDIKIELSNEKDLCFLQYQNIWFEWFDPHRADQNLLSIPEKQGLLIVFEDITDVEAFLRRVDQINLLGIILMKDMEPKILQAVESRGIRTYRLFSGQSFILKTDGKKVWISC